MLIRSALLAWVILVVAGVAQATPSTSEEIEACVRANLPPETSVQTISFVTHNRLDEIANAEVKLFWKRLDEDHSNLMLRFEAPLDRRGSALLMLQKERGTDIFMYLPELDRTRRLSGRMVQGSMFGTDFSYEEFQRLQGLADDVEVRRLDDSELNGQKVFVLEHFPRPEKGSAPERVLSYIEPERCVQLRAEFFEKEGAEARKVLDVDTASIVQDSGLWIPRKMTMNDRLDGTRTDLLIEKIEIGVKIPKKVFTQAGLGVKR